MILSQGAAGTLAIVHNGVPANGHVSRWPDFISLNSSALLGLSALGQYLSNKSSLLTCYVWLYNGSRTLPSWEKAVFLGSRHSMWAVCIPYWMRRSLICANADAERPAPATSSRIDGERSS